MCIRDSNIVVASSQDEKAKNIIEAEVFGKPKTVHLAIFGHGNVGTVLIDQILESAEEIKRRKKLQLKIVAVSNSRKFIFDKDVYKRQVLPSTSQCDTKLASSGRFFKIHCILAVKFGN